jgi:hypothetical protein
MPQVDLFFGMRRCCRDDCRKQNRRFRRPEGHIRPGQFFAMRKEASIPDADRPRRMIDVDGSTIDVFALPVEEAALEALLRDLFENHWREITFGPIIQGAAYEFKAPSPPTHIGTFDGYLTIAFGAPHFHICIGEHKGTPGNPASPALARHRRTSRAELYRRLDRPQSRGKGLALCSI